MKKPGTLYRLASKQRMDRNRFRRKWLASFAAGIPRDAINEYVKATGNYIWHIFSWELLEEGAYLSGAEARAAFDAADKSDAVYIDWFADKWPRKLEPDTNTAALDGITEVYAAAADFSWTYIKTHEINCGPYFMKKLAE